MPAPDSTCVRVPARVGLVGNPSDGFGGAVLAAIVDTWAASVTVRPSDGGLRVCNESIGTFEWAAPDAPASGSAVRDVPEHAIVIAALAALHAHVDGGFPPVEVEWSSTIPRSVGLAGSSAIAVAAIEAVAASADRRLDPRVTASLALEAETVGLGIAAGWQDRMVQAFRCAVLVDAAHMTTVEGRVVPAVRPVPVVSIDAVVGWRSEDSEDSGAYHGELRRRADSQAVSTGMNVLATLARRAAACAERGDVDGVRELVDASWRTRRETAPLGPAHERLVETVRATGAVATSPGSGGSVVALPTTPQDAEHAIAALESVGAEAVFVRLQ